MIWRNTLIEQNNILKMIGLAVKARKCVSGSALCIEYIKKNRVKLLLIASDTTDNTKNKVLTAAYSKNLRIIDVFSKEQLGSITGKEEISVIGITDYNFASGIIEKITKEN